MFRIILSAIAICLPSFVSAQKVQTNIGPVEVTKMVDGFYAPWAIAFLPKGEMLVTERDGELIHISAQGRSVVSGVPKVFAQGQGGLLDVVTARDFLQTRDVFITYAEPVGRGGRTALGVGRLSEDGKSLTEFKKLFAQKHATNSGHHFGSRVVEAPNGDLFLTIGDRGDRNLAQSMDHFNGKVMRVSRKGVVKIHSLGHRNPQGATLDQGGNLWTVEHGPKGGDEINQPQAGLNYGWPIISYGKHYTGFKVGEGKAKEGLVQPKLYWDPSIAPSGMMIYQGDMFPEWNGDIFVGSLKFDMISRSEQNQNNVVEKERLFQGQFERIRDIRQAPDGSIWFLAVGEGAAYRISR